MNHYTSQFGKYILVLITQLRPTSLLNRVVTTLSSLNLASNAKQWGIGLGLSKTKPGQYLITTHYYKHQFRLQTSTLLQKQPYLVLKIFTV